MTSEGERGKRLFLSLSLTLTLSLSLSPPPFFCQGLSREELELQISTMADTVRDADLTGIVLWPWAQSRCVRACPSFAPADPVRPCPPKKMMSAT